MHRGGGNGGGADGDAEQLPCGCAHDVWSDVTRTSVNKMAAARGVDIRSSDLVLRCAALRMRMSAHTTNTIETK